MLSSKLVTRSVGLRFLIVVIALALAGLVSEPALAQTTSTWSGGSGNWSPCPSEGGNALWDTCSSNVIPNGNFNAVIQGGPVFATGASVVNLSIASADVLNLTPGYVDITGQSLFNQGTINIGASNGLGLGFGSVTTTISGGGAINLTNPNARVLGAPSPVVNQDNPIHGQGYIGVTQFTNQSLIDANVSAATLILQAGGNVGITNTGTVQASNGGTLQLTGLGVPFNNTGGIIQALNGSVVQLNAGYVITGGTLSTSGTGTFQETNVTTLNNLVSNANYQLINGNITILEGTITNNGTFRELQGGLEITGNTTLKGTGVVKEGTGQLLASNTPPATLINQITFQGGGFMGDSGLTITNQGTIIANTFPQPDYCW